MIAIAMTTGERRCGAVKKATLRATVFARRMNDCEGPATIVGRTRHLVALSMSGKLYRSSVARIRLASRAAGVIGRPYSLFPCNENASGVDFTRHPESEAHRGGDKLSGTPRIDDNVDLNVRNPTGMSCDELTAGSDSSGEPHTQPEESGAQKHAFGVRGKCQNPPSDPSIGSSDGLDRSEHHIIDESAIIVPDGDSEQCIDGMNGRDVLYSDVVKSAAKIRL